MTLIMYYLFQSYLHLNRGIWNNHYLMCPVKPGEELFWSLGTCLPLKSHWRYPPTSSMHGPGTAVSKWVDLKHQLWQSEYIQYNAQNRQKIEAVSLSPPLPSLPLLPSSSFFLKNLFYLFIFLAVLDLRCYVRTFSSCDERELLFVVVRGLLIVVASLVADHGL